MTIGSKLGQNTQVNITEHKWFQSYFLFYTGLMNIGTIQKQKLLYCLKVGTKIESSKAGLHIHFCNKSMSWNPTEKLDGNVGGWCLCLNYW